MLSTIMVRMINDIDEVALNQKRTIFSTYLLIMGEGWFYFFISIFQDYGSNMSKLSEILAKLAPFLSLPLWRFPFQGVFQLVSWLIL